MFKMKLFSYLLLSVCIFSMISCGDNEVEIPDDSILGFEYFPLDIGYEWVYSIDSVLIIQGGNGNINSSSFLKEEITELISDIDGEKKYTVERSYKKDSISNWRVTGEWTVSMNKERAIRNEGNLSFIKMVFPAVNGTQWDGHVFFDDNVDFPVAADFMSVYKDWEYNINAVDPRTISGTLYSDIIDVTHIDEITFISKRFSTETYARDLGLVERKMEIFDTQNGDESLPWLDRAQRGFQLTQTLVSFTKN